MKEDSLSVPFHSRSMIVFNVSAGRCSAPSQRSSATNIFILMCRVKNNSCEHLDGRNDKSLWNYVTVKSLRSGITTNPLMPNHRDHQSGLIRFIFALWFMTVVDFKSIIRAYVWIHRCLLHSCCEDVFSGVKWLDVNPVPFQSKFTTHVLLP